MIRSHRPSLRILTFIVGSVWLENCFQWYWVPEFVSLSAMTWSSEFHLPLMRFDSVLYESVLFFFLLIMGNNFSSFVCIHDHFWCWTLYIWRDWMLDFVVFLMSIEFCFSTWLSHMSIVCTSSNSLPAFRDAFSAGLIQPHSWGMTLPRNPTCYKIAQRWLLEIV